MYDDTWQLDRKQQPGLQASEHPQAEWSDPIRSYPIRFELPAPCRVRPPLHCAWERWRVLGLNRHGRHPSNARHQLDDRQSSSRLHRRCALPRMASYESSRRSGQERLCCRLLCTLALAHVQCFCCLRSLQGSSTLQCNLFRRRARAARACTSEPPLECVCSMTPLASRSSTRSKKGY